MTAQRSRALLLGEMVVLMIPLSLLLALVFIFSLPQFRYSIARAPIVVLATSMFSVVCLWRIGFCFLSGGAAALRALSFTWWSGAVLGAFIALAALASQLAPASPPYSAWAEFRERFDHLTLGLPLIAPLLHLGYEALCQRGSNEVTTPNVGPAMSLGS